MTDGTDQPEAAAPAKRGEARWKAVREEIAAKNAKARKHGKEQREAREREASDRRRALERSQMSELRAKKPDFR